VNLLSTGILIVALAAGEGNAIKPEAVTVSMVAVRATIEGREEKHFDAGLEAIRKAVADLPYDTYRKVKSSKTPAPFDQETKIGINKEYSLYVTPLAKKSDGRIRMKARIEMQPKDEKKKAINTHVTTALLKPGKKLKFCGGMKADGGELVVIISIED